MLRPFSYYLNLILTNKWLLCPYSSPTIWVGKFRIIWGWALFTAPMGPIKDQNGVYYYMVLLNNN